MAGTTSVPARRPQSYATVLCLTRFTMTSIAMPALCILYEVAGQVYIAGTIPAATRACWELPRSLRAAAPGCWFLRVLYESL